jgi:hypothetical protein
MSTIPTPDVSPMLTVDSRTLIKVTIKGMDVIYDSFDVAAPIWSPSVLFAIAPDDRLEGGFYAAIRTGVAHGRPVLRAAVSCGGAVDADDIEVMGEPDEITAVHSSVPHIYAGLGDVEERKVLRSIYRYLEKRQRALAVAS